MRRTLLVLGFASSTNTRTDPGKYAGAINFPCRNRKGRTETRFGIGLCYTRRCNLGGSRAENRRAPEAGTDLCYLSKCSITSSISSPRAPANALAEPQIVNPHFSSTRIEAALSAAALA